MSCCGPEEDPSPRPRASVETASGCCGGPAGLQKSEEAERSLWIRFGAAVVVAGQGMVWGLAVNLTPPKFGTAGYWALHSWLFLTALLVMVLLAGPLFRNTWDALHRGKLTVEALFTLSLFGALAGSLVCTFTGTGSVYYEVVAVVLAVYTVGKQIGARTRRQALAAVSEARDTYDFVYVKTCCGSRNRFPIDEIDLDTEVNVQPGEAITVDGTILSGDSFVHEMTLTGEATPVVRRSGDRVLAGTYAVDGELAIQPSALRGRRVLDGIFASIESARERPSEMQEQADAITRWFLPAVVLVSLATLVGWWLAASWHQALFNSMAVLLVACPCALGLATPIALWGGLYRLSRLGIVSRSGRLLDALSKTRKVFFDKTGTLSESCLMVVDFLVPEDSPPLTRGQLLHWVGQAESAVAHPVARALARFAEEQGAQVAPVPASEAVEKSARTELKVRVGLGLEVHLDDGQTGSPRQLLIGELDLMPAPVRGALANLRHRSPVKDAKKAVYFALDGAPAGVAVLDETLRNDVPAILAGLVDRGVESRILTGDVSPKWEAIEGVEVVPGLAPRAKEQIVQEAVAAGEHPLFIGDGTNDAPAMSHASASLAMQEGTALARASADATLAIRGLANLNTAIDVARDIRAGLRGNLIFAASYNTLGMGLAAGGVLHPVVAALLMVVSSALVSTRAARSINKQG